ncbi:MAG TPA: hypothetical protein DD723_08010 [Candidatus Omnitrophica bacterium]|nr:MAG: hypothetical protein A2Z81_07965 [Omnitrophica WOR_2 bacterium GWA2_45_18]HBR15470.1 hypothetical protein [Candidatus Omnitrophota bacterium]
MSKFSYIVKDLEGKAYKNVVDAASQEALIEKLQKENYFIVSIKELTAAGASKTKTFVSPSRKFTHHKVKLNDLLIFARQLSTMIESGVSLTRALDVIQSQVESKEFSLVLSKIKTDVERGGSLSQSLAKHPRIFNQFWVSLLEVGEASGTIPVVITKLGFYLEQQAAFRSTIVSGLVYPAILFMVSMGAVIFFALFVAPRFEAIFSSMKVELPLITKVLLGTFKFIKANFLIIIGIIVGIFFSLKTYCKTYHGKIAWEKFIFSLPTVGEVYKNIIVERFSSQMAILIDAGVPILYALDITERLVDNNVCALIVNSIKEGVKKGELFVNPMIRSGFFPPMSIQMIMVGEETGELSKMLKHVADYYQNNVQIFMKRFSVLIEPFMLVFMGGVIGTIVLAMFLPMFNIAQLGGGGG